MSRGYTLIVLAETDLLDEQIISLAADAGKVIGVDGGCAVLHRLGISPDLVLGDFDSLDQQILHSLSDTGAEVLTYPEEKDMTDGELALLECARRKWGSPLLTGTAGGRETDHLLGNIFLLAKYPEAVLHTRGETIRCAGPGTLYISRKEGPAVSLIPLEPAVFSLHGFMYDGLQKVRLGDTRTLRNRLREDRGILEINLGKILIIQGKEQSYMI